MKKTFLLILCCIAITITSCSLNDDSVEFNFVPLQIVDAEFPESFTLNETYNIKITYVIPNNCIAFEGFDISNIDITSRNIVAIGSERLDEVCNLVAVEAEGSLDFICLYEGTYFFRMWTGEDENGEQQYIELEVPVVP
ncbi:MAG: hypothetical protein WBM43_07150 [Flavobacteriaceae bacterium]